jgi:2-succinyl-5-enolpyruvyl-6-hydroxy-3-cyclohexene-1-carboxylate synthase
MTSENLLSEWSRLLVESLADAGIRDAIISPGSRSTSLVWAFSSSSRIRCLSIVDERSAAFFAVGHAKSTGTPALILCTSGSAAANYFPAIVEASLSRTPLVVVTADRPFELMDASASQTIDQTKIYGNYVRRFVELGMPDATDAALLSLRRRATQAVSDALAPEPGPVHLNFRARKPLEPVAGESQAARELTRSVDVLLERPIPRSGVPRRSPDPELVARLTRDCSGARRGVIVCGPSRPVNPATPAHVARLASLSGFPVYAEATSQLRFAPGFDLGSSFLLDALDQLLKVPSFRGRFTPDLILQIGEPPVSAAWDRFVGAHSEIPRHVIADYGWPDPHGSAQSIVVANVDETLCAVAREIETHRPSADPAWSKFLALANDAAWRVVDSVLHAPDLSEAAAIRAVSSALPAGSWLSLGNSLPVRHADAFIRCAPLGVSVLHQRGTSGIDGVVSATAGAARATGRPTTVVLGDLSALHDVGGFAAAASVETPLVVVVLNNDGGRIFEQLPVASSDIGEDRLRLWTTPHGRSFAPVSDLFRIRYERPETAPSLARAVAEGLARPGSTLIEVRVPPHGVREQAAEIVTRLEGEIAALGPE